MFRLTCRFTAVLALVFVASEIEATHNSPPDCNGNGITDWQEDDCNGNRKPDDCDVAEGYSADENSDGIPDECQSDEFVLTIAGDPILRTGGPGSVAVAIYECTLMPPGSEQATEGPTGWTIAVATPGLDVVWARTSRATAMSFFDNGFELTELTEGEGNEGIVSTVALSHSIPVSLPPDRPFSLLRVRVRPKDPDQEGVFEAALLYKDGLRGSGGPIENTITLGGDETRPALLDRPIEVSTIPAPFRRADANADGRVDISDGISMLNYQFIDGAPPHCFDALDANDDGRTNISDAVFTLNFLFLGGESPPAPGPDVCGTDSTDDEWGCLESPTCG